MAGTEQTGEELGEEVREALGEGEITQVIVWNLISTLRAFSKEMT